MYLLHYLLSLLIWLSPLLISYLLWLNLRFSLKSAKIFDAMTLFFALGFLIERFIFVVINQFAVASAPWAMTIDPSFKPAIFLNLTIFQGFDFVTFILGGVFGIFIYNSLNSSYKFRFNALDILVKLTLPLFFVSEAILIVNWDFQNLNNYQTRIVYLILLLILTSAMFALYSYKKDLFEKTQGVYSAFCLILVAIVNLVINYIIPDVHRVLFNIFNPEQILSIILIIFGVNILLNIVNDHQELKIRREVLKQRPLSERGFAISFANRRRITNPLDDQLRKIVKSKNKIQRKRQI